MHRRCTGFHTSVDVFSIRVFVCVCVCRSSCLVLQGKCLWYHKKKIEEYRKKEKQKERLHINKKKEAGRNKRKKEG